MKLVSIHKQILLLSFLLILTNLSFAQKWSLQQCLDTAKAQNKNLQIAINNIKHGVEKQKEAKANLIPKLMIGADYKYFTNLPYQLLPLSTFSPTAPEGQFKEAQFGVPHNINASIQLVIPLYNSQIYGGIEATKIATELTDLQYEKSKEQVYFEISNLYYNAQIVQTQLTFLDSNLINAQRLLSNIEALNLQKLITSTEVEKVKLQIAQLKSNRNTIQGKYDQIINVLKFIIGISIDSEFQIETNIVTNKNEEYNTANSTDSRIVQTQFKLINNEIKSLNRSRYLPSLNLFGSFGTSGFGYDKKPHDFLNFYPIGFAGIQLSYSLFNGTVTLRKIKQKQIERSNNELKLNLVNDQNTMLITNAQLNKNTSYQTIATSQQEIELAQKIYNNTILMQKQGLASLTEVILADNALRETQQTQLSAIINYLKADLELKKLTGNIK